MTVPNMRLGFFITAFLLWVLINVAISAELACLKYEPTIVELTGKMKRVTFPGPPNYQSVKEGDKAERHWVLSLSKPVCVEVSSSNDINQGEPKVESLQLVVSNYEKYRSFLGKRVTARGTLMHAITGHHHTDVLLQVDDIKEPTK